MGRWSIYYEIRVGIHAVKLAFVCLLAKLYVWNMLSNVDIACWINLEDKLPTRWCWEEHSRKLYKIISELHCDWSILKLNFFALGQTTIHFCKQAPEIKPYNDIWLPSHPTTTTTQHYQYCYQSSQDGQLEHSTYLSRAHFQRSRAGSSKYIHVEFMTDQSPISDNIFISWQLVIW